MRIAFILVWLLLVGCMRTSDDNPQRTVAPADSAIYAVLLDSLRPGTSRAYVGADYLVPSDTGTEVHRIAGWVANQAPDMDSALVVAVSLPILGSVRRTIGEISGVNWFATDSLHAVVYNMGDTRTVIALSRVAIAPDSTRAAVYGVMVCGALCGEASYYLLKRDSAGQWRVTDVVMRSVS
jgi:hypothetical protein